MKKILNTLSYASFAALFWIFPQDVLAADCVRLLSNPESAIPSKADLGSCAGTILDQPDSDRVVTLQGMLALEGIGVKRSKRAARQLFERAAQNDYGPAQHLLAQLILNRLGVDAEDYEEAGRLLQSAGSSGVPDAVILLGQLISSGKVSAQVAEIGTRDLVQSAKSGNPAAQVQLALLMLQDNNVSPQAAVWLREAAKNENADAQFYLGQLIRSHPNLRRTGERAEILFAQAARAGHAASIYELGVVQLGENAYADALSYFTRAAQLGNTQAYRMLGQMHFEGKGIARDPRKAAAYWFRAAQDGDDAARLQLLYNFDSLSHEDQLVFNATYNAAQSYATPTGLVLFANHNMDIVQRGLTGEYIKGELSRYHDAMSAYGILAQSGDPRYATNAKQINARMEAQYDTYVAGLKDRRQQRKTAIWLGLGVGVLALLSLGGGGEYQASNGVTFDPCAGIDGLGWYGGHYAGMAAVTGCKPY